MTDKRQQLAEYQARLLAMLYAADSPDQAIEAMHRIADDVGLQNEVHDVDLRMIDVAMQLTKKWGVVGQRAASDGNERGA